MASLESDPQVRRISVRSTPSTVQSSHELSEVSNRQYREQFRLYDDEFSSDDSGVIRHISVKSNLNDPPFDDQRFVSRNSTQESQDDANSIQDSIQNSVQSSRYSKHDYSRMLNIANSAKTTQHLQQQQPFNNLESTPSPPRYMVNRAPLQDKKSSPTAAPAVPAHSSKYPQLSPPIGTKRISPNRHSMIEMGSPASSRGFTNSPSVGSINANRLSYMSTYSGVVQDVNIDTVKYVVDNSKTLDLPPDVISEVTQVPSGGQNKPTMTQSPSLQSLNRLLRSSSTGTSTGSGHVRSLSSSSTSGALGSNSNSSTAGALRNSSNTSFTFPQPPNILASNAATLPKLSDVEDNEEESFSSTRHVLPTTKTPSNESSAKKIAPVAATAAGVASASYALHSYSKSRQAMRPDKEQTTNLEVPVPPRSPKRPLSGNFSSTSIEESLHKFEEDQLKTPKQRQQEKLMRSKQKPESLSVLTNISSLNANDQASVDESHTPQISLLETPLKRKSISSDSPRQQVVPPHPMVIESPASSVPLSNPLNEKSEQGSSMIEKRYSSQESLPSPFLRSASDRFSGQERRITSGATGFSETPERRMSGLINDKFDDIMKEFEHLKSEIEEQALTERKSNEDEIISDEERLLSKIHEDSANHRKATAASNASATAVGAFGAAAVAAAAMKARQSSTASASSKARSIPSVPKNIPTGPVSTAPVPIAKDLNNSTSRVTSSGAETITSTTSITPELLSSKNTVKKRNSNNDLSIAPILPSSTSTVPIPGMMARLSPTHRRALSSDTRDMTGSPTVNAHRRNQSAVSAISGLSTSNEPGTPISGYYTATSQNVNNFNNFNTNNQTPIINSHKRANSNTSFTDRSYSLSNSVKTAESFVTAREDEYYDPAASFFKSSHSRNNSSNNAIGFGITKGNSNTGTGVNPSTSTKNVTSLIPPPPSGTLTTTTSGESEKFPYDPNAPLMKQDTGSSSASDASLFEGDKENRRLSRRIKLVDSSNEDDEELYEDIDAPITGKSSKAHRSRSKKYGKVRRSASGKDKKKKKVIRPFSYDTLARLLNATDGIVIGQEFADLQIPNEEKYLIEKIVDSISRLTANMMLNPSRYQQGCNRLEKVLNALEGFE